MRSKLLGFAVVATALAATINALAYSTASVTNDVTLTVAATDSARLAFSAPDTLDSGLTLQNTATSYMTVAVGDSVQPNSTYKWAQGFKISNNLGAGSKNVSYSTSGAGCTGLTVKLYQTGTSTDVNPSTALNAAASLIVDLEIATADSVGAGAKTCNLIVSAG